jgi:hypothetical protein
MLDTIQVGNLWYQTNEATEYMYTTNSRRTNGLLGGEENIWVVQTIVMFNIGEMRVASNWR